MLDHLESLNSLCIVLGIDFKNTIGEIHPTLGDSSALKSVSTETIEGLSAIIHKLREVKIQRLHKVGIGVLPHIISMSRISVPACWG